MTDRPSQYRARMGLEDQPSRQPVFNIAPVLLVLLVPMAGIFALTALAPAGIGARLVSAMALSPVDLWSGDSAAPLRVGTLLTHAFAHGDWLHLAFNSVWLLVFGTPLVRRFSAEGPLFRQPSMQGQVIFLSFFLTGVVLASLAYAVIHARSGVMLIGASGGVSALMAAAMRVILIRPGAYSGGLLPLWTPQVLVVTILFMAINFLTPTAVGGLLSPGADAGQIAWEVHVVGYLYGLVGISFFDRLTRHRD